MARLAPGRHTQTVGFSIPFSLPDDDIRWSDVSKEAPVVLERSRIISALETADPRAWEEWDPLKNFVADEIQAIHDRGDVDDEPSYRLLVAERVRRDPDGAADQIHQLGCCHLLKGTAKNVTRAGDNSSVIDMLLFSGCSTVQHVPVLIEYPPEPTTAAVTHT